MLTPNDWTANLYSFTLYIYSTNIFTEYFKHGIYSPFFSSSKCSLFHYSNVFGSCIIHIFYTEYAKIKKNNSFAKRYLSYLVLSCEFQNWPYFYIHYYSPRLWSLSGQNLVFANWIEFAGNCVKILW